MHRLIKPIFTLTGALLFVSLAGCSDSSDNGGFTNEVGVQALCALPEADIEINTTAANIEFVRTPDACFDNLVGYPFDPNYVDVEGLRYHYVDAGPRDGEVILMLHGQPTWSYLYRKMIPVLVEAGYRVIAPDHIGMGRSDKPVDPRAHQYEQHVAWMKSFVSALSLSDITLFVQDWGSLIGLRMAGDDPEKFARIVVANGDLALVPEGFNPFTIPVFEFDETIQSTIEHMSQRPDDRITGFQYWVNFAASAPHLFAADMVDLSTGNNLTKAQFDAYNAPFPARIYWGGIRAFPSMAAGFGQQNVPAYEALGRFERPFLFIGGENDPNLGSVANQNKWVTHVPGAAGQPHTRYEAGHFIQEQVGEEMAAHVVLFMQANPLNSGGPEPEPDEEKPRGASGNLPDNCTGSASDYICSADGLHNWAADAGCTAGDDEGYQQDRQTYVGSLNYVRDDGAMWKNFDGPTTITLSLPKEDLKLYIEALLKLDPRLPPSGSIWPGVQFQIEGGASSILQPVLWMGGNFSVPDKDGNLPSYVGVYSSGELLSDPDLDTYSFEEAGRNFWQPEMRLHWWAQRTPEDPMEWLCVAINGDNGDDHCPSDGPTFSAMLNWAAESSFPLVNSQYVIFDENLVPGQVVEYDQISRDIYVVNDNMDVELELTVPAHGAVLSQSPIEIKSTLTPLGGDQTEAVSILNVSRLLNVNQSSATYEFTDATPGWSWANSYIQRFYPFVFEDFVNGSSKEECEDRIQETIGALSVFQNLGVRLTTLPSPKELPDPQMD